MQTKIPSLFLGDIELGKKDDDHRRSNKLRVALASPVWTAARVPPRRLMKRVVYLVAIALLTYLFVRHMPTDVGIRDHRRPVYNHGSDDGMGAGHISSGAAAGMLHRGRPSAEDQAAVGVDGPEDDDEASYVPASGGAAGANVPAAMNYNGPIRLENLLPTLRAISSTRGAYPVNKNILFAAASLKSATTLLPAACQMGSTLRNYVHFVLIGRNAIEIEDLEDMNGIDESCHIIFHDARPDRAAESSDDRMEKAIDMAFKVLDVFMHPQAVIVDATPSEDPILLKAMRRLEKGFSWALIELPHNGVQRLAWFTKLDSASLANWNKISIDILIHAYPGASGSLIRLLRSLSKADFGSGSVPHVTLELPQQIDLPTEEFLSSFQWPPSSHDSEHPYHKERKLSLRHRIPRHGISEEDSSVRFLESFWPTHPQNAHVLVLSPQVELSPDFFHYVKFALLEYRYSTAANVQQWGNRLFGISLDLPATGIDGTTKLTLPASAASPAGAPPGAAAAGSTPFLWESPNSNAILLLGEHWTHLHSFVAQMLEQKRTESGEPTAPAKLVSKKYPAWLEYALQLCRARGYWTLYPSASTAGALATVHNELYQPPEEYSAEAAREKAAKKGPSDKAAEPGLDMLDKTVIEGDTDDDQDAAQAPEEVNLGASAGLLDSLPAGGRLPLFANLPMLSWSGEPSTLEAINAQMLLHQKQFRLTLGGCTEAQLASLAEGELFCAASA